MATTGVDPVFLDTNILVNYTVASAPVHAEAMKALGDMQAAGIPLWISRQILREYIATQTRPQGFRRPLSVATVLTDVAAFQAAFQLAEDGPGVMAILLNLLTAIPIGGKQIHDANIVATMLAHGIPKLLTHNTADFARFVPQITVVPLVP